MFSIKEDAKQVVDAKDVIKGYAKQASEIEVKIKELEEKTKSSDEEISSLFDSISDIKNRLENFVTKDPYDRPDDYD